MHIHVRETPSQTLMETCTIYDHGFCIGSRDITWEYNRLRIVEDLLPMFTVAAKTSSMTARSRIDRVLAKLD